MSFLLTPCLLALRKQRERSFYRAMTRRYPAFLKVDQAFQAAYYGTNRYTLCHEHFAKKGFADPYVYGETPLKVFYELGMALNLGPNDLVLDLGCGAGRGLFFLQCVFGCQGIGIDEVPIFVEKAEQLTHALGLSEKLAFHCGDLEEVDIPNASVVYIAGTCFEEGVLEKLCKKLIKLPKTTVFVSVSEPLSESCLGFKVIQELSAQFLWGKTSLYVEQMI